MLLIDQIKGKVGGNVAKREGHHWMMLQAVVDSVRIGVRNVVRQGNLDDPIRLSSFQFFATKLEAHQRRQVKQVGVRDLGADEWAKRLGVRGNGRFIWDSAFCSRWEPTRLLWPFY